MDDDERDLNEYKNQAKQLFKKLSLTQPEPKCSLFSEIYWFHYYIEFGVCYLCICHKSYPKKLAFQYLEEIQKEFHIQYGQEMQRVARPYAFVKFDSFIQKTKKQYQDSRTEQNLQRLNDDLTDVTRIMTKNVQDVLGRGERLDLMSQQAENLKIHASKYHKDSRQLNWNILLQRYGLPLMVILSVIILLLMRYYFF